MYNADDAPRLVLSYGRTVPLAGRMSLERAGHNDVTLDDDLASREHAEIEVAGDQVLLRDLGSSAVSTGAMFSIRSADTFRNP